MTDNEVILARGDYYRLGYSTRARLHLLLELAGLDPGLVSSRFVVARYGDQHWLYVHEHLVDETGARWLDLLAETIASRPVRIAITADDAHDLSEQPTPWLN